ncbi:MAG: hypothetical protein M3Y08_16115, partial [Fibrobacterota bacterium]|nr:hypothetical protein [Fibrobacterota bacterium]
VVVFDFTGEGISQTDGVAMTQQFIAEMQRLDVFHTLDRSGVVESMQKKPVQPEKCISKECRLDIARRLTADNFITVQASRLDTVFTFTLSYVDAETGEASTTLTKVYAKRPEKLLAEGFGDLALELQNQEAAFLNLSVSPVNTVLTIDNTPMAVISSRVPLNPGKHRICGSSPGYETECKDFEVKRADALTYSLILPVKAGTQVEASRPPTEDEIDEDEADSQGGEATTSSHHLIWWAVGGMAVLAAALALAFNTKD